jgi:hypothetical protein
MDELITTLAVAALFLIRIGIPVALLVGLGVLIDRWQSRREAGIQHQTTRKA